MVHKLVSKWKPLFSTWQWLTIIGGLVMTTASWTAYAFATFEQKVDLHDILSSIRDAQLETNNRLRSIESAVK